MYVQGIALLRITKNRTNKRKDHLALKKVVRIKSWRLAAGWVASSSGQNATAVTADDSPTLFFPLSVVTANLVE